MAVCSPAPASASRSSRLLAPLLAWTLLLGLGLTAAPARAALFQPESFTLDNGLQVVVIPDHRIPVVHHMVWYKVGAADEPAGRSGLAHLLEHLMFKGTETLAPGDFSRIVARNGGRDNAFTGDDYTAYHQTIARDRLKLVMEMEADRMAHLRLAEEDFQTERDVVREERRARTDTEPRALLSERMGQALWGSHPYSNPVIGWEHELQALTRADALAFYDRFYAPDNAVVVVAGDVTAAELRPLAEDTYGQVPARGDPATRDAKRQEARPRALPPPAAVTVTMRHAHVGQASVSRHYIAPSLSLDPQNQAHALAVLEELLGGGPTSRLHRALVVDQGLAVSAGSWYRETAVDWGTFGVYALPRDGVSVDRLTEALDAEIARLLTEGVTQDEVARARHRLVADLVYTRDSLSAGARILGKALATGGRISDVESWPDRIAAVTAEEVMAAARAVLGSQDRAVTGLLLPDPTPQAQANAGPGTPAPADASAHRPTADPEG